MIIPRMIPVTANPPAAPRSNAQAQVALDEAKGLAWQGKRTEADADFKKAANLCSSSEAANIIARGAAAYGLDDAARLAYRTGVNLAPDSSTARTLGSYASAHGYQDVASDAFVHAADLAKDARDARLTASFAHDDKSPEAQAYAERKARALPEPRLNWFQRLGAKLGF